MTAAPSARSPLAWAVPIGLVVVAVVVAAAILAGDPGEAPAPAPTTTTAPQPAPIEISSDAPTFTSLEQLVDASDLIVRGRVADTQRGRWFGDGATSARIQSRLVTLDVEDVLAGEVPSGELDTLLLEEEGWLEDGAPLVVDGAAPSAVGDEGIWFLVDPGDDTTDALIVVNAQGRYLVDGDHLAGAAGDDDLVAELSERSEDQLAARVAAAG
ncbi:hypothetical protein ACE2AJ_05855 [Aquihabitans daechungensis]|uniref:hypothetical protein n=1 Tax=Aquihabitans daechungensis TaxID=1052257 RepID=UPI003BA0009F